MAAAMSSTHASLAELIHGLFYVRQASAVSISGLCQDSRRVQKGDLFFALEGGRTHGKQYIDEAIRRGAHAVLYEAATARQEIRDGVPLYAVPGLKQMAGIIAERFYGEPSKDEFIIGVTGTNGKTSISQFIAQGLQEDAPCGVIGTLGNGVFGRLEAGGYTTPDAVTLHTLLDDFHHDNIQRVVMEVSSHGLEQGRVAGVAFDVAVFSNLSHEHLDYHGDMASYGRAKRRLFECKSLKYAVLNIDDDFGRQLLTSLPGAVGTVSYGFGKGDILPSLLGSDLELDRHGLRLHVESDWGQGDLQVPLLGKFNAYNLLAALGALLATGIAFDEAMTRLSRVTPVPGRMQGYGGGQGLPLVVVDYAHTPDALEQVLLALRAHTPAKVWCLFGCGGDRDRSKRAVMAAVAERLADRVMVTDDNPRSENSDVIIADILQGFADMDAVTVIADRAQAIAEVVAEAGVEDVVLVAGKGHENYQIVGDERRPFSDTEEVQSALAARGQQFAGGES
jgi:UDP-N-acetylmuramoyl-L-alanyl-D-glutamate--2,6-diaminopimelate ligase